MPQNLSPINMNYPFKQSEIKYEQNAKEIFFSNTVVAGSPTVTTSSLDPPQHINVLLRGIGGFIE